MLSKALASSHTALACALLVLAAAAGVRGANEYFPENVAVRELPPPLQARNSSSLTPSSHPIRATPRGRDPAPDPAPAAQGLERRFLMPSPSAHAPPR